MFSFCLQGLVVLLFCSPQDVWIFWFFALKLSNCSPLKLVFSEGPSFFLRSVCNHGALKLRLHVVALSSSLAMAWSAEFTKNSNRSGLDFSLLVLQSSNSFILNAFFNFASVNFFLDTWFMFSFCLQGLVVLLFCSPYDDWMFFLFFGLIISKCSPLKLVFSGGPSFFVRPLCNHGALKLRLHEVALSSSLAMAWSAEFTKGWTGQVRIWLLTSSLTEFKQFYSECFFQFCFSSFLPGYMVHVQFLPSGSCGSFVLFSIRWLNFLVFWFEKFKLFPVKDRFFRRPFIFCTSWL